MRAGLNPTRACCQRHSARVGRDSCEPKRHRAPVGGTWDWDSPPEARLDKRAKGDLEQIFTAAVPMRAGDWWALIRIDEVCSGAPFNCNVVKSGH